MIIVVSYDRKKGRVLRLERFSNDQRERAQTLRLELERGPGKENHEIEVVLLEAASEEALQRTHAKYFKTFHDIVNEPRSRAK
jgi:hypothetical protein